jgi:hypothetical protein
VRASLSGSLSGRCRKDQNPLRARARDPGLRAIPKSPNRRENASRMVNVELRNSLLSVLTATQELARPPNRSAPTVAVTRSTVRSESRRPNALPDRRPECQHRTTGDNANSPRPNGISLCPQLSLNGLVAAVPPPSRQIGSKRLLGIRVSPLLRGPRGVGCRA